ncbi:hypothetical protein [Jannaschia sp. R86511]|uniref:hypothetical protein n=1 Tax=Jannaschia sp. R86511 TaxID=3093853 RepID=UPI0036D2FFD4
MGWVIACVLIALVGLVYLFLQAREVWRKARLLLGEVEAAAARAEAASQPTSHPAGPVRT